MELLNCSYCSKEFFKKPSQIKKTNRHYCSRSCAAKMNNSLFPKVKKREKYCKACNSKLKNVSNVYCNIECMKNFKKKEGIKKVLQGKFLCIDSVKKYLLEIKGNRCEICKNNGIWNNNPLILEIDHIDGNSDNNSFDNIRLLCPNCHSQTETYTGRNKKDTKRNCYLRSYKSSPQKEN